MIKRVIDRKTGKNVEWQANSVLLTNPSSSKESVMMTTQNTSLTYESKMMDEEMTRMSTMSLPFLKEMKIRSHSREEISKGKGESFPKDWVA